MKKITIGLITIVVLVIFASGCTNNNNSTGNNSSVQNNSNIQHDQNVTLKINSNSSWNGTLSYKNGTQNIDGRGSAAYDLGQNPGNITVNLQKTGNDNGTITLQLLKGGTVVVNQSTNSNHGTVSLSYTS